MNIKEWIEEIDRPLIDILPQIVKLLNKKQEMGIVILWNQKKKDYETVIVPGTETEIQIPHDLQKRAVITAHTHPYVLYPKALYRPPTAQDYDSFITQFLLYGQDQPNDYILDKVGIWRILGLTPAAAEALSEQTFTDENGTPRVRTAAAALIDIGVDRANTFGLQLMRKNMSLEDYVKQMSTLWNQDMGITVIFVPYSFFITK